MKLGSPALIQVSQISAHRGHFLSQKHNLSNQIFHYSGVFASLTMVSKDHRKSVNSLPVLNSKYLHSSPVFLFLEHVSLLPKILYLVCPIWFPSCPVTRIPWEDAKHPAFHELDSLGDLQASTSHPSTDLILGNHWICNPPVAGNSQYAGGI